jgi:hypothetical protein
MLKIVGVLLAVLVVGIAIVAILASMKPDAFRVQRSVAIKATPDKIFPLINEFRNWPEWSPYEKKDPAMKRTLGSATSGKGATYAWDGDKNVGEGRMEITDASPPSKVVIKLDFLRSFKAHNTAEFTLAPKGETTDVTWAIYGPNLFVGKVMGLFINMDNMIGKDFETGLANLKSLAER